MIITKAENIKELFMIEIQGEIEYNDCIDGVRVGKLEEGQQKCKLTIGNHVLRGKIEHFAKPLVVVEKQDGNLQVIGLIKKKIIFSERPAPIPDHFKQIMRQMQGMPFAPKPSS